MLQHRGSPEPAGAFYPERAARTLIGTRLMQERQTATSRIQRAMPRWPSVLLVLLLVVAGAQAIHMTQQEGCGFPVQATPEAPPRSDPPRLILLQRRTTDVHTGRLPYLLQARDHIDSLPFDGFVVNIPASWDLMKGLPIAKAEIDAWLAPLKGKFQRVNHNFVEVMIDDPGDVFDDRAWEITVENWRRLAASARDAGFDGIFFDNEEYKRRWLDYPEDYPGTKRSLEEYREQTRLRGRQIMQAIVAEFPDITLLVYHGPYLSEPKTPPEVIARQASEPDGTDLGGPLFVGFLEGLGPRATLVDGGEVYAYRTMEDFARSYAWRKFGMASPETDSSIIPERLRAIWPERVSIAFGVYNLPFPDDLTMTPAIMRTTLENALLAADDYVWFFTDGGNWLLPGGMPSCWYQAVRSTRAAVGLPDSGSASPIASHQH
ncbi:MAG: hypothetical protein C4346_06295 [Chloroflexota bacterium]